MSRDDKSTLPENVVPAALSRPKALQVIRELAENSDNIVTLPHCVQRMRQRKISITQVRRVVKAGFIDGDPWFDPSHADWRVTMRGLSAGQQITIEVAIDWKTKLLIITVF